MGLLVIDHGSCQELAVLQLFYRALSAMADPASVLEIYDCWLPSSAGSECMDVCAEKREGPRTLWTPGDVDGPNFFERGDSWRWPRSLVS